MCRQGWLSDISSERTLCPPRTSAFCQKSLNVHSAETIASPLVKCQPVPPYLYVGVLSVRYDTSSLIRADYIILPI